MEGKAEPVDKKTRVTVRYQIQNLGLLLLVWLTVAVSLLLRAALDSVLELIQTFKLIGVSVAMVGIVMEVQM